MTLLIASVALALLATGWVVMPLLSRRMAVLVDVVPGARLDADARRRVALASLKELEHDFVAGKLDDADYAEMRARLSREALEALRAAEAEPAASVTTAGDAAGAEPVAHGCGFVNARGSRFCAGCGAALA